MSNKAINEQRLLAEVQDLRLRLDETLDTLNAIRTGQVDALVVIGPHGEQVYTLKGAEEPYRVMVETMNAGAVTFSPNGIILYCNARFAEVLKVPMEEVIGSSLKHFVAASDQTAFEGLLEQSIQSPVRRAIGMQATDGTKVPVQFSTHPLNNGSQASVAAVLTDLTDVLAAAEFRSRLAFDRRLL